jgi:hypothetical protein
VDARESTLCEPLEDRITVRTLSQIETGSANPTWAIAGALGVSIADLSRLSEKHK